ncbi:YcgN family cysteine cluster protein [Gymnodinialimonas sp. 57CJ19]|uniref:YcgN family cysteine cluster protein n=1 Tax=Gymnodinialimonas sp. 57CJ19 TaxID=3138498 RepID=UPI0031342A5A
MRDQFWDRVPPSKMTAEEWEALCDGCGKCCLNKLEDEDTQEVALTRVACRLLDDQTCLCGQYEIRKTLVPECIQLTPGTMKDVAYFMPATCAYRLVHEGKSLNWWHPLISGDPETVHQAGVSVRGITVPEFEIDEEDWDDYIIEEPGT